MEGSCLDPLFFPHKGMCVLLSVCTLTPSDRKTIVIQEGYKYIHRDHITPNIILIMPLLKNSKHQRVTRMKKIIDPCDFVGLKVSFSWQLKLVDNLLCYGIHHIATVNNQITKLAFALYLCSKYCNPSPIFFFSFMVKSRHMMSGLSSSVSGVVEDDASWQYGFFFFVGTFCLET